MGARRSAASWGGFSANTSDDAEEDSWCAGDATTAVCDDGSEVPCTDERAASCGVLGGKNGCDPREEQQICFTSGEYKFYPICKLDNGAWTLDYNPCNTPLVLAFGDSHVSFTHPQGSFDVVGVGASFDTDWVGADTPWLALDRNGNGRIDDGSELFGSMSEIPGGKAKNGFEALAAFDDDKDGRITPADAVWSRLLLWSDVDQDRASSSNELTSLASRGVRSLELGYRIEQRCSGFACEVERAAFQGDHGGGQVVDVHFAIRR